MFYSERGVPLQDKMDDQKPPRLDVLLPRLL